MKFELNEHLITQINDFGSLVREWNRFSLIAKSTESDLWGWHFSEALSLIPILHELSFSHYYDFGAGGGVLGYTLFLAGFNFTLVERSANKLFFLNKILKFPKVCSMVTSYTDSLVLVRGVDNLINLLRILNEVACLILLKSYQFQKEVQEARKFWSFKCDVFERKGLARGVILVLTEIKPL